MLLATNASLNLVSSGQSRFILPHSYSHSKFLFLSVKTLTLTDGKRVLTMVEFMLQKEGIKGFLKPNEVLASIVVPFSASVCKLSTIPLMCAQPLG